jgi:thymidine phosphorylase
VHTIDNRLLSRLAKLAGAPHAHAAGLERHIALGQRVERGESLLTLHAETPGELAYALSYLAHHRDVIGIGDDA